MLQIPYIDPEQFHCDSGASHASRHASMASSDDEGLKYLSIMLSKDEYAQERQVEALFGTSGGTTLLMEAAAAGGTKYKMRRCPLISRREGTQVSGGCEQVRF